MNSPQTFSSVRLTETSRCYTNAEGCNQILEVFPHSQN